MTDQPESAPSNKWLLAVLVAGGSIFLLFSGFIAYNQNKIKTDAAVDAQGTAYAKMTQAYQPPLMIVQLNTATMQPMVTLRPTITIAPTFTPFVYVLPTRAIPNTPASVPIQSAGGLPADTGICSCSGDVYNCSSFGTHNSAQACFEYCRAQGMGDVHDLDRDGNGSACESLP